MAGRRGRGSGAMTPDPRLRGHLQRALASELQAVQQYLAQACLVELWGLPDYGRRFRQDAHDEVGHAERLTQRMLVLGIVPNSVAVGPVRLGRTLEEILLIDRELEIEVVQAYDDAALYSTRVGDAGTAQLFSELLEEEIQHLQGIDQALDELRAASRADWALA